MASGGRAAAEMDDILGQIKAKEKSRYSTSRAATTSTDSAGPHNPPYARSRLRDQGPKPRPSPASPSQSTTPQPRPR